MEAHQKDEIKPARPGDGLIRKDDPRWRDQQKKQFEIDAEAIGLKVYEQYSRTKPAELRRAAEMIIEELDKNNPAKATEEDVDGR
jgi:hypothetical protein